ECLFQQTFESLSDYASATNRAALLVFFFHRTTNGHKFIMSTAQFWRARPTVPEPPASFPDSVLPRHSRTATARRYPARAGLVVANDRDDPISKAIHISLG